MIAKRAESYSYARRIVPFRAARNAFGAILQALEIGDGEVLLPAYIGWSAREGSGVFDPITALRLRHRFYALDERLHIDLDSLATALDTGSVRVLVLIHYFGYIDPAYAEAVALARQRGAFVIEDEAHAMLSDVVGGVCGRLGDACVYSFHKMLPVEEGGAAVVNDPQSALARTLQAAEGCRVPQDFDLSRIAAKRRANASLLDRLAGELSPEVTPLRGAPITGEVPQSYPVLIRNGSRDRIYREMNAAGFGVVSLYHTLISEISPQAFPAAAGVASRILNLPVHQDASPEDLEAMVWDLAARVRKT